MPFLNPFEAWVLFGRVCGAWRKCLDAMMACVVLPLQLDDVHSYGKFCLRCMCHAPKTWFATAPPRTRRLHLVNQHFLLHRNKIPYMFARRLQHLTHLQISMRIFEHHNLVQLAQRCPRLEVLRLSTCFALYAQDVVCANTIKAVARHCPKLRELSLGNMDGIWGDIFGVIASIPSLRRVALRFNPTVEGWHRCLPAGTPVHRTLETLEFKEDPCSMSHDFLFRASKTFPNLQTLTLPQGRHIPESGFVLEALAFFHGTAGSDGFDAWCDRVLRDHDPLDPDPQDQAALQALQEDQATRDEWKAELETWGAERTTVLLRMPPPNDHTH